MHKMLISHHVRLMNVPCILNLGRASIEITRQFGNYSFDILPNKTKSIYVQNFPCYQAMTHTKVWRPRKELQTSSEALASDIKNGKLLLLAKNDIKGMKMNIGHSGRHMHALSTFNLVYMYSKQHRTNLLVEFLQHDLQDTSLQY